MGQVCYSSPPLYHQLNHQMFTATMLLLLWLGNGTLEKTSTNNSQGYSDQALTGSDFSTSGRVGLGSEVKLGCQVVKKFLRLIGLIGDVICSL